MKWTLKFFAVLHDTDFVKLFVACISVNIDILEDWKLWRKEAHTRWNCCPSHQEGDRHGSTQSMDPDHRDRTPSADKTKLNH